MKKENRVSSDKPNLASQISVMDMATNGISNLRNKSDSLPGYSIPKWNHDRDRALQYNMSKYNGGGMLDTIVKSKR